MNIPDIRILSGFATDNDFSACGCHIRSINTGHINSTFEVESRPDEDGLCCRKYIVQKINTIFSEILIN